MALLNELQALTTAKIELSFEADSFYSIENHSIVISLTEVEYYSELWDIDYNLVFHYFILHEIGHSLDEELRKLKQNFFNSRSSWQHDQDSWRHSFECFQAEVNAWRIADSLVDNQTVEYKAIRKYCLTTYCQRDYWIKEICPDYF